MSAALNAVEPPILERETARLLKRDKTWYKERLPLVEDRVRDRLDGAFSAAHRMFDASPERQRKFPARPCHGRRDEAF